MRRILIVDDRPERPKTHLSKEVVEKIKSLEGLDFVSELTSSEDLSAYDVIAMHRTYVKIHDLQRSLHDLACKEGKFVILYSGGISQLTVSEQGHMMTIPASEFYSGRLLQFCEDLILSDEPVQLFKLVYGRKGWKLPLCMRIRQILWQDPELESDGNYEEVQELKNILDLQGETVDEAIEKIVKGI